jgi:AraC family transcriptional regulator, activator of mtrCDE
VAGTGGPPLPVTEEHGRTFATRRTLGAEPDLDLFCGHYHFETATGALIFRLMPRWYT